MVIHAIFQEEYTSQEHPIFVVFKLCQYDGLLIWKILHPDIAFFIRLEDAKRVFPSAYVIETVKHNSCDQCCFYEEHINENVCDNT